MVGDPAGRVTRGTELHRLKLEERNTPAIAGGTRVVDMEVRDQVLPLPGGQARVEDLTLLSTEAIDKDVDDLGDDGDVGHDMGVMNGIANVVVALTPGVAREATCSSQEETPRVNGSRAPENTRIHEAAARRTRQPQVSGDNLGELGDREEVARDREAGDPGSREGVALQEGHKAGTHRRVQLW